MHTVTWVVENIGTSNDKMYCILRNEKVTHQIVIIISQPKENHHHVSISW